MTLLKEPPKISVKKKYGLEHVGKEFSGIAVFLIFLMLMVNLAFPMPRVYKQVYAPTTISSGSLSVLPEQPVQEWINMLKWMRDNLKSSTVVCSWWDYGYWLTVLGNVTSMADNATVNSTQIENIGFIFIANETQAMKMLERYKAEYILVYTTIDTGGNWVNAGGDEGKWTWMAAISGNARYPNGTSRFVKEGLISEDEMWTADLGKIREIFGNVTLGWNSASTGEQVPVSQYVYGRTVQGVRVSRGQNSTIYKLMNYARERWIQINLQGSAPTTKLLYFREARIDGLNNKSGYGGFVPLVCLYKIDWEKYYSEHPSG
jgi:dolichyl-diphosphooligosaccharide--protein glycosyltransferase